MSEIAQYHYAFEGKDMKFDIAPPNIDDTAAIGPVHLQSWVETYQNPEIGVDEAWIRENYGFLAEDKGTQFRQTLFEKMAWDKDSIFYRVAKDEHGEVIGFCHAERYPDKDQDVVEALYLLESAQGQGLGHVLMQQAIDWLGDERPIKVSVVDYNKPAIDFYKRHGFEIVPGEPFEVKAPIMAIDMIRPVK